MQPVILATTSGSGGASNWLPLSNYNTGYSIGFYLVNEGSAARSTVQLTSYDVGRLGTAGLSAQAIYEHATLASATTDVAGSQFFPAAAVRVVLTSGSSTAIARLTVVQAGK